MDLTTILILVLCIILGVGFCMCLAIANFAGGSYYEKFKKMNNIRIDSAYGILNFFNYINFHYFDGKIVIYRNKEDFSDAYSQGRLFLSPTTLTTDSLASYCIIAHECGHALQDKTSKKLKHMAILRRTGRIIGVFLFPLLIAGIICLFFGGIYFYIGLGLAGGSLLIFLLAILLKFLTIRIEKDASKNAMVFLKEVMTPKELKLCKKFLRSTLLTYWSDLFRSLLGWTFLTKRSNLFR